MSKTELNGKPAITIQARFKLWGVTPKAKLYKIEEDEKWVPVSVSKFEQTQPSHGDIDGVLTVEEWWAIKYLKK